MIRRFELGEREIEADAVAVDEAAERRREDPGCVAVIPRRQKAKRAVGAGDGGGAGALEGERAEPRLGSGIKRVSIMGAAPTARFKIASPPCPT
jgi:hypothetical protein